MQPRPGPVSTADPCGTKNGTIKGQTVGQVKYPYPVKIIWDCVRGRKSNAYAGSCISGCDRNTGESQQAIFIFLCIFTG